MKLLAHGPANLEASSDAIRRFPELIECHANRGPFDFLLRIVTRDVDTYERVILGKLSGLPRVQEINSTTALSWLHSSKALPVQAH